jgi:hypothetical protein
MMVIEVITTQPRTLMKAFVLTRHSNNGSAASLLTLRRLIPGVRPRANGVCPTTIPANLSSRRSGNSPTVREEQPERQGVERLAAIEL